MTHIDEDGIANGFITWKVIENGTLFVFLPWFVRLIWYFHETRGEIKPPRAAILDLKVKVTSDDLNTYSKWFSMPEIVEKDMLFLFVLLLVAEIWDISIFGANPEGYLQKRVILERSRDFREGRPCSFSSKIVLDSKSREKLRSGVVVANTSEMTLLTSMTSSLTSVGN